MSFNVFLQAFGNNAPAGWPIDAVRAAFAQAVIEEEDEDFWRVSFASGESSDLLLQSLDGDAGCVHCISVYRPCDEPMLWQGLWTLLQRPGAILHFPGIAAPLGQGVSAEEIREAVTGAEQE